MQRTRRTRVFTAALTVAAVPALAACGGFNAVTTRPYAPADGALANSGDIRVQNILVVAAEGSTTGVVSTAIANRGNRSERLLGMTSPQGTVNLTGNGALPANSSVSLGSGTDLSATVTGLTATPGRTVRLVLTFAHAQPLTIDTLVVQQSGYYASITAPAPSPS